MVEVSWETVLGAEKTLICGYPIVGVTMDELVSATVDGVAEGLGGWIVTLNLYYVAKGLNDPALFDAVRAAEVIVSDGAPIYWALRKKRLSPAGEHVTGATYTRLIIPKVPAEYGAILGGHDPNGALRRLLPEDDVAKWFVESGKIDVNPEAIRELAQRMEGRRLVLVALGVPKQEWVIHYLRQEMPNTIFVGVGGSLDFVAGVTKRAPEWMQRRGMEWLYRLFREPRRLWRRVLVEYMPGARALLDDVRKGP